MTAETFRSGSIEGESSLVELLDRVLERGAVLSGDLVLSVAEVDLAWIGLQAVIGGIEHAPPGALLDARTGGSCSVRAAESRRPSAAPPSRSRGLQRAVGLDRVPTGSVARARGREPRGPSHLAINGDRVEDGLVQLVLSVVELVRQVMERQALRRLESGGLTEDRVEQLGLTLMRLAERMEELREAFGFEERDLLLGIGPVHEVT